MTRTNLFKRVDASRQQLLAFFMVFALLPSLATADEHKHRHPKKERPGMISITGEGSVSAEPDMATISSGVVTESATAREALSKNTETVNRIFATIEKAGIEKKDFATSNFNVQPLYKYFQPSKGEEQRPPQIIGYRVSNQVSVRVRDLEKLGALIDQFVSDGSNQMNGITFGHSNIEELRDKARVSAIENATARAKLYAQAAGVKIGRILKISEGEGHRAPHLPRFRNAIALEASSAEVPIAAGEQEISVSVSVRWEIEQ